MLTELSDKKTAATDKQHELPDSKITGLYLVPKQIFDRREVGPGLHVSVSSSVQRRRPSSLVHGAGTKEPRRCRASSVGSSPSRFRASFEGRDGLHGMKLDGFRMAARISHGLAHFSLGRGSTGPTNIQASSRRSRT